MSSFVSLVADVVTGPGAGDSWFAIICNELGFLCLSLLAALAMALLLGKSGPSSSTDSAIATTSLASASSVSSGSGSLSGALSMASAGSAGLEEPCSPTSRRSRCSKPRSAHSEAVLEAQTLLRACSTSGRAPASPDSPRASVTSPSSTTRAHAQKAFDLLEPLPPSALRPSVKRNLMLKAACILSDQELAEAVMSRPEFMDVPADQFTYFHMLKVLTQAARPPADKVEALMRNMAAEGVMRSEACDVALVDYCFKQRKTDAAVAVLEEALAQRKTQVGHPLFAQVVRGLIHAGNDKLRSATTLLVDMGRHGHGDMSLSSLLSSRLISAGRKQEAVQVVRDANHRTLAAARLASPPHCTTLVRCCALLDQPSSCALDIFRTWLTAGGNVDTVLVNCVLDSCVQAQDGEAAAKLFAEVMEPKAGQTTFDCSPCTVTLNTLMRAMCQQGKMQDAWILLQAMPSKYNIQPTLITYNTLIQGCVQNGHGEKGWELLGAMQARGIAADSFTFSTLIMGLQRQKRPTPRCLDRAFQCFTELRSSGGKVDEVMHHALMDTLVHFGHVERAEAVLDMMVDSGLTPGRVAYGILMKGWGARKQLCKALRWKEVMEAGGIQPNAVIYGCLIDTVLKCGMDHNKAVDLLNELEERRVEKTLVLHSLKIRVLGRKKDYYGALAVLADMRKQGLAPVLVTYNALVDALSLAGSAGPHSSSTPNVAAEVQKIEGMMARDGVQPDLITLSAMLKAHSRVPDLQRARATFTKIQASGFEVDEIVCNSLIDAAARSNNSQAAREIFDSLPAYSVRASPITFSILIKAYAGAGEVAGAFGVLELMASSRVSPTVATATCLVQACVSAGELAMALRVYNEMHRHPGRTTKDMGVGVEPSTPCSASLDAVKLPRLTEGPDSITFGALIVGCTTANRLDVALRLVDDAEAGGTQLTSKAYQLLDKAMERANRPVERAYLAKVRSSAGVDNRVRLNEQKRNSRW